LEYVLWRIVIIGGPLAEAVAGCQQNVPFASMSEGSPQSLRSSSDPRQASPWRSSQRIAGERHVLLGKS
jgi:hypothetical protein